jgi:hypothetical protein
MKGMQMKWFVIVLSILVISCDQTPEPEVELPSRSFENKVGTVFTAVPSNVFKAPTIEEIQLPMQDSIDAIWGATGLDDDGNVYIGMSSHGGNYGSAFLYQYNPITGELVAQSDVVSQLKHNKVYREGMRQNKLHSKFYQADDGYLYFSSFDEEGEAEGINPKWGGNLWRKKPNEKNWQHLLATEEALVGINTNGRFVYALGYWDHVLYQYDTKTGGINRVVVGSVKEHVSRNFIVDELGHVYVPRLVENDFNEIEAHLVEYDIHLKQVASYPMPSYRSDDISAHHGIVGYTSMKNGDIYFTTSEGGLYQIKPFIKGEGKLKNKGLMHPNGEAYIASLFTYAGESYLAGVGRIKGSNQYEWLLYEINSGLTANYALDTDTYKGLLLYGSLAKSKGGGFFVGGWNKKQGIKGYQPVLLKLSH